MKPNITQQVKSFISLKIHQDPLADRSSGSGSGKHRRRKSVAMFGISISMLIGSFPVNCPGTIATASEKAHVAVTQYQQGKISTQRTKSRQSESVSIAQSLPAQSTINASDRSQFSGELSIPISVPAPKSKNFKPVASIQHYLPNGDDGDSELFHPGDNKAPGGKPGETSITFRWPAAGTLTSRFGRRWGKMHKGIDIAGPIGTPINSAAPGTVIFAGWSGGYGNLVEIRHADGTTTRYGHNSRLIVSKGQTVAQGQQVSEMGSTGHSTGSHLHFEIRPSGGEAVNPMPHLPDLA